MPRSILVPLAALVLAMTACANAPSTGPGGGIDHPAAADAPILVISMDGGFVPAEYTFTRAPMFALYGDGTLVVPGAQTEIYPGQALPPMIARTIDEDGLQAILREALDAGLDRDGDYSDLGQMGVADASTTRFQLTVNGTTHTVTAYALGMEGDQQADQPDDVWAMRQRLAALTTRLGVLDWLPSGFLGSERPYASLAARLLVGPYQPDDQLPQRPTTWPLAASLASFGEPTDVLGDGWRCGVLDGDGWTAVQALAAEANQLTPWLSDGRRWTITFRPLLPDEHGCGGAR